MKKLVLAVVLALGLCVFAALPASAESGTREAVITYRNIKLVLDGREICPRDAYGNEVEPFILDGTTYLPVRAVADALGLEVRWRGSDSTVMLSDPMTGSTFRDALPAALETVIAFFYDENGVLIRYEYGGSSFGEGTVVTSYEYVLAGG